jgi:hypothetical protein
MYRSLRSILDEERATELADVTEGLLTGSKGNELRWLQCCREMNAVLRHRRGSLLARPLLATDS